MKEHPEIKSILIDTTDGLKKIAAVCRRQSAIGVDLEADSMYHYRERVCLIQIAAGRKLFIVDPVQIKDLSPLKPIFKNKRIKKIFHGADYDVRSLYRDFRIEIHHLFDTELASRFIGFQHTALNVILNQFFDVTLDKKYQKKDWSIRPLPQKMIEYAARDVYYLIPLAEILEKQLQEKKRLSWVAEECELLSRIRPNATVTAPLFLSFKGAGSLSPRGLAVLESLLQWRKQIARKKDLPLFKVIGARSILAMAKEKPLTMNHLKKCRILSAKQIDMYGNQFVEAVVTGMQRPESELPEYPRTRAQRHSASMARLMKKLKIWKDKKAGILGIDPALILTKMQIIDIVQAKPKDMNGLENIDCLKGWQIETLGKEILDTIA